MKVLMAEDKLMDGELFEIFFKITGYEVKFTKDGKEVLNMLSNGYDCDVLIIDYNLPEINGIDLAKKVKGIKPSLPILGISNLNVEKGFIEEGADFFISKPVDLYILKKKLEFLLK